MSYLTVIYPPEHYPNGDIEILQAIGPPPRGQDSEFSGSLSFDGRVLRFRFSRVEEAEEAQARVHHARLTGVKTTVDS